MADCAWIKCICSIRSLYALAASQPFSFSISSLNLVATSSVFSFSDLLASHLFSAFPLISFPQWNLLSTHVNAIQLSYSFSVYSRRPLASLISQHTSQHGISCIRFSSSNMLNVVNAIPSNITVTVVTYSHSFLHGTLINKTFAYFNQFSQIEKWIL